MNFTQKQTYEILEQVVGKEEGLEQIMKMMNNPTEGGSFWDDIFDSLKQRGVKK